MWAKVGVKYCNMSHPAQRDFCTATKKLFPHAFKKVSVVEFGSLNINGSVKSLFEESNYVGVDIVPGRNVDALSLCHEYEPGCLYDTVVSCEMLEHDPYWLKSIKHMYDLLKVGGLLIITCAGIGRAAHSPLTVAAGWNHYRNLDANNIIEAFDSSLTCFFSDCVINIAPNDLRFWGIKKWVSKATQLRQILRK